MLAVLPATGTMQARGAVNRFARLPRAGQLLGTESFVGGFSADTPERVAAAAALGVRVDILYEVPPSPSSPLGRALVKAHMKVIDANISNELTYWECHRTHTVAPPPRGEENYFCARDLEPSLGSSAALLAAVRRLVREDSRNPLVAGYWVLDDWASWDPGSGRALLQRVHNEIEAITPGYPAICGFGGAVLQPGQAGGFDPGTADNYSNSGCDAVGLYNYADSVTKPTAGTGLDWGMKSLLREEMGALEARGWAERARPLLGIPQAWSGPFQAHYFQPGLSVAEMVAQAHAFCAAGAKALAWYAWDDSGFGASTLTPDNSTVIRAGIVASADACSFAHPADSGRPSPL
jgi:hypothetical protein